MTGSIARRLLLLALPLLGPPDANLLVNGSVEDGPASAPKGWAHTPGASAARFSCEPSPGKSRALSIANESATDRSPHNWNQRIELPARDRPKRLEVSARAWARGLDATANGCVMLQLWDKAGKMVGAAWSDKVQGDADGLAISAVVELPETCTAVRLLAWLIGRGQVWYDDLAVRPTTKEPRSSGGGPPPHPYERLVRECAIELPWLFDAEAAKSRAAKEGRPILLYVRCIDDDKALAAAQTDLRAATVAFHDDGLRKDILFRAGPLSDPDLAALVERRFVPLCLTYDLSLHGMNPNPTDPLRAFKLSSVDVVTPAVIVLDPQGRLVHRLHRFGTLSATFVDRVLLETLKKSKAPASRAETVGDPLLDGEPERALELLQGRDDPASRVLRARAHLRLGDSAAAARAVAQPATPEERLQRGLVKLARGDDAGALEDLDAAALPDDHPRAALGRFWAGWCLLRQGRADDARKRLEPLVGPTRFGRKAAACLLPEGPRLPLAETAEAFPMPKAPPETTESGDGKAPFDPARSVGALLKMQRPDGSFGGHLGAVGEGLHDAAITALAGEALLRWRPRLTKPLAQSAERALQDAQTFLDRWSKRGRDDLMDPFNNPYALLFLLRLQAREAAARVAVSIARTQQKDHNWTVYQAERPASFNTALNVLALAEAKAAAIRIDEAALASGAKALEAMRTKEGLFPYSTMKGHEWMTTRHGSIARDALCELALFRAGRPTLPRIATALERFLEFDQELRVPTKKLYDYFNVRGHGGYYFFFAYRNAVEAALHLAEARRKPVFAAVRAEVLAAQEFDGTWIDHAMIGRAYGTAQALWLLAVTE